MYVLTPEPGLVGKLQKMRLFSVKEKDIGGQEKYWRIRLLKALVGDHLA